MKSIESNLQRSLYENLVFPRTAGMALKDLWFAIYYELQQFSLFAMDTKSLYTTCACMLLSSENPQTLCIWAHTHDPFI